MTTSTSSATGRTPRQRSEKRIADPLEGVESFDDDTGSVISSIMNSLWNAAGRRDAADI